MSFECVEGCERDPNRQREDAREAAEAWENEVERLNESHGRSKGSETRMLNDPVNQYPTQTISSQEALSATSVPLKASCM